MSSSGYCCGAVPNHSRSSLRSSCGAAAKLLRSRCDVVAKLSRSRLRSSGDAGTKPSRKRHEATARLLRNRSNVIAGRCRCEAVARAFKMLRSRCGAITRLRNCSDAVAMLVGMLVAKLRSMFRSCVDAAMQCHVCEAIATVLELSETVAKLFSAAPTRSTMQCDTYKSLYFRCFCDVVAKPLKRLRSRCGAITRLRSWSVAVAIL